MKRVFEIKENRSNETLVELNITKEDKYISFTDYDESVRFTNCTGFTVLDGEEGKSYSELTGGTDEHDEYLILHFKDKSSLTYRNSHVGLFVLKGLTIELL